VPQVSAFSSTAVKRLRARRTRRLLLILAALVVVLIAIALLPQGQHRGGLTVPTAARSGEGDPTGAVRGVLRGVRTGTRVCFTLEAPQGHVLLVLPPGWSADTSLRLHDAGGQTRATAGATMTFLGTPGAIGTAPGCTGAGRLWYTTDVRLPSR
jgi:hypothetical protein